MGHPGQSRGVKLLTPWLVKQRGGIIGQSRGVKLWTSWSNVNNNKTLTLGNHINQAPVHHRLGLQLFIVYAHFL